MAGVDDGGVFAWQAAIARDMGAAFTARLLEATARQLPRAPATRRCIAGWPGDRRADNVALRVNGALHALARRKATAALAALYRDLEGDMDAVLGEVLAQEDATIASWLDSPPQTNEVGRSAAIWAALTVAAARFARPMELLELGSSAGLNLNLARYGYDLAGQRSGDLESPLQLRPHWRGAPPPQAKVEVRRARGVDLSPLDLRDPASRERLSAFVWPDDPARLARLEQAMALALAHPPALDQGDAADWIEPELAEPQSSGTMRIVFHSIVLQYLPRAAQERVRAAIIAAGERASADAPLGWIAFEWDPARACAALTLTTWPGGHVRELATCQAHAAWIAWSGD